MSIDSFVSRVKKGIKEYREQENARADRRLSQLKTQEAREKAKAQITKDRLKREKEIAEAQTALHRAEISARKANKELKDLKGTSLAKMLGLSSKKKSSRRK